LHSAVAPFGFCEVMAELAAVLATPVLTVLAAGVLFAAVLGATLFPAVFDMFEAVLAGNIFAFVVFDAVFVLVKFAAVLAFLLPLALLALFAGPPPHASAKAASEISVIRINSLVFIYNSCRLRCAADVFL